MLIFDIGANIGRYSLTYAIDSENTIISVEASPNTYNILKINMSPFINVTALEYAVCNSKEPYITFYNCQSDTLSTLDINWLSSSDSRFGDHVGKFSPIQVKTITLDVLIDNMAFQIFLRLMLKVLRSRSSAH